MNRFQRGHRFLRLFLAATLFYSLPLYAVTGEAKTGNVGFKVRGDVVEIYYDLTAPSDQVYNITVTMKRRFDKTFSYIPVAVSGDVGQAVIPGESKLVTWKLNNEFPNGLPGDDCFFVIEAEVGSGTPESGISPYIWVAGGAAVVVGIVVIAASHGGGGGPQPPPPAVFPNPPGRP